MGIYAAPLLAAWIWFAYVSSHEGAGVSVNGELIVPAVPLEKFDLVDGRGTAWPLQNLREKWSMVYFSGPVCDDPCEKNLYNMRQVRLSTGRRMDRVQRILVTTDVDAMDGKLAQASEGLAVVGGSIEQVQTLKRQILKAQDGMGACEKCIYLVDPFGNVMMRFPPELEPGRIYKDLKHLLKVSRIG
ncbi:hypothetical protein AB833_30000 [Chromatiales bacterium (ex Bugula neritina AB1)]|nr:hypothetical protein AB833_30000 [Chromatiales bacterium (ex Bugula neritina AB1)]